MRLRVPVDNKLTMEFGGDATIKAAVASASLTKVNADYASVKEQSGIKAGDDGFQINVKGNTDLKGAVIASTDQAVADGKNSLTTASLTTSEIQNHDQYKAQSLSVSLGGGGGGSGTPGANTMNLSGTKPSGSAGYSQESGSQHSTTASGISAGAITITNDAQQKRLTGQDGATTVASLNRNVASDKDTSNAINKAWDANKLQEKVQAEAQIVQSFGQQASKAAADYSAKQIGALRKLEEQETDPVKKAELQEEAKKWGPNGSYTIAMNILIASAGGGTTGAVSAVTKESLSWAANEMRKAVAADSNKFAGICDANGNCLDNKSGKSESVNGDNKKYAGGRVDLDFICGESNARCETLDEAGKVLDYKPDGTVKFKGDLAKFLEENPQARSPMGGWQGRVGQLFPLGDYLPGSFADKLAEAYAGTHDTLNKPVWYGEDGNIRRGMSETEKSVGEVMNKANVVIATPFAAATLLPPEVWNAISTVLKASK